MLLMVLVLAFLGAFVLTGVIRWLSLNTGMIDVPGERSSHSIPTPRGGGLAFVIVFLCVAPWLSVSGYFPADELVPLWGAGMMVAMVGLMDDYRGLSVRVRLLVHFFAAIGGLYGLSRVPAISVFGQGFNTWLLYVLLALYLVWLLNLYNFMDGIDGIAGTEAITVLLGFSMLSLLHGNNQILMMVLLAVVVAGFLGWNFPPARIFMGDAGSGFLGMMLGLLSLQTSVHNPDFFWCWVILLGVFVVDASVTLLRRILRRQKFYQAHRSHAFQYASRLYKSHRLVTLVVGVINLCFLLPIAFLVASGYVEGFVGVLVAYVPLVILAFYYKAGAPDLQASLA